jgi:hypothetical protein
MKDNIIIAIAIGAGSGFVIATILVIAYVICKRNGVRSEHHGIDLEKNEQSLSQETSSTSTATDVDYLVAVHDTDSISTLTRSVLTGMDIMVETVAKEWTKTEHDPKRAAELIISHHSPIKVPKKIVSLGDHESVGTIKISNCANLAHDRKVARDDLSVGTEKVNNCTPVKAKRSASTYLSGPNLDVHNEKLRTKI